MDLGLTPKRKGDGKSQTSKTSRVKKEVKTNETKNKVKEIGQTKRIKTLFDRIKLESKLKSLSTDGCLRCREFGDEEPLSLKKKGSLESK